MRFNIDIEPVKLTDEQLYAESRELKFLPAYFKKYGMKSINKVPKKFTLGTGHILFFVYKPNYSLNRYKKVIDECRKRGILVTDESYRWNVYNGMTDNYKSVGFEKSLVLNRIKERIVKSTKTVFHYYHRPVSKEQAIKILMS